MPGKSLAWPGKSLAWPGVGGRAWRGGGHTVATAVVVAFVVVLMALVVAVVVALMVAAAFVVALVVTVVVAAAVAVAVRRSTPRGATVEPRDAYSGGQGRTRGYKHSRTDWTPRGGVGPHACRKVPAVHHRPPPTPPSLATKVNDASRMLLRPTGGASCLPRRATAKRAVRSGGGAQRPEERGLCERSSPSPRVPPPAHTARPSAPLPADHRPTPPPPDATHPPPPPPLPPPHRQVATPPPLQRQDRRGRGGGRGVNATATRRSSPVIPTPSLPGRDQPLVARRLTGSKDDDAPTTGTVPSVGGEAPDASSTGRAGKAAAASPAEANGAGKLYRGGRGGGGGGRGSGLPRGSEELTVSNSAYKKSLSNSVGSSTYPFYDFQSPALRCSDFLKRKRGLKTTGQAPRQKKPTVTGVIHTCPLQPRHTRWHQKEPSWLS